MCFGSSRVWLGLGILTLGFVKPGPEPGLARRMIRFMLKRLADEKEMAGEEETVVE